MTEHLIFNEKDTNTIFLSVLKATNTKSVGLYDCISFFIEPKSKLLSCVGGSELGLNRYKLSYPDDLNLKKDLSFSLSSEYLTEIKRLYKKSELQSLILKLDISNKQIVVDVMQVAPARQHIASEPSPKHIEFCEKLSAQHYNTISMSDFKNLASYANEYRPMDCAEVSGIAQTIKVQSDGNVHEYDLPERLNVTKDINFVLNSETLKQITNSIESIDSDSDAEVSISIDEDMTTFIFGDVTIEKSNAEFHEFHQKKSIKFTEKICMTFDLYEFKHEIEAQLRLSSVKKSKQNYLLIDKGQLTVIISTEQNHWSKTIFVHRISDKATHAYLVDLHKVKDVFIADITSADQITAKVLSYNNGEFILGFYKNETSGHHYTSIPLSLSDNEIKKLQDIKIVEKNKQRENQELNEKLGHDEPQLDFFNKTEAIKTVKSEEDEFGLDDI